MSDLPTGWTLVPVSQVTRLENGDRSKNYPSRQHRISSGVPFINAGHLKDGRICHDSMDYISRERFEMLSSGKTRDGDVLFCLRGSLGKTALVDDVGDGAIASSLVIVRPSLALLSKYLHYFLSSPFTKSAIERFDNGTAQPNLASRDLGRFLIPVAPIAEQDRIVAAIEEQFSCLNAGVAALEHARQNLKRMRAAVLQAAVTGQLTRAVTGPITDDWSTCTPSSIAANKRNALTIGPFGSSLKVSDYRPQGVPLVFVRQVRSHIFGGADTRFISKEKAEELRAHRVQGGDVLITKMGEPPGDATVYPSNQPDAVITADVIKLSVRQGIVPEYIALAINSKKVRDQFAAITSGVAQQKVSLARFRQGIHIPLPPAGEQSRILEKVNYWMQEIDQADASIKTQLARAASLRSSILAAAFAGKLAPQDPADEPASILLQRIVTETASSNGRRPSRGRNRRVVREETTA